MNEQSRIMTAYTGYNNIQVTKSDLDDLCREVWNFSTHRLQNGELILDHYSQQTRETRRHKFRIIPATPGQIQYERIGHRRHSTANSKAEDVPLSEPIKQAALDFVINNLKVVIQS